MLTDERKRKARYLNQYRYIKASIDRKIKNMEEWRHRIYSVTAVLSDMPHSEARADTISVGLAEMNEIEANINSEIEALYKKQCEIESHINGITDVKLQEILKCRYFDGKTWEVIAYENSYGWRQVYNLHEKALDSITLH